MKDKPYERYEVIREFEVKSGEVASWFGETGGGKQYYSYSKVKDLKGNLVEASVKKLVENKYLEKLD